MNHSLGFSFIGDNNNNNIEGMTNNNKKENNKRFSKNKTRKNAPPSSSSRVESMMAKIHENANKDDDDEDGLASFDPPPRSVSSGVERMRERDTRNDDDDEQVTTENFDEMQGNQWQQEYYKQHIPMYTNAASNDVNTSGELLEKLNYMIHLLEEERDVKQGNVTEEVVLYCFLGVFVIFVVDSFAKVGKYVR